MASAAPHDDLDGLISTASIAQQPDLVRRLLQFLGLAYDAIFLRDTQSTIVSWDAGAEQLYGWTEAEARGRVSHELLQTEFPPLPLPIEALLLRDGQWEGELSHERRDGTRIVVESRQVALRDASGAPVSILETNRDASERRRMEQALQVSRSQLESVLQSAAEGIMVQGGSGEIVYANDAAAQLCGFASAESLHTTPIGEVLQQFELLDEAGAPFPPALLPARQVFEHGRPAEALIRFRPRRGGVERWAISRAQPVLDGDGAVAFAVSAFQDVSALKMEELRERFLGQASALLAQSLDYDTTLAHVAELAVPQLADWAAVDLIEPDASIRQVALAHHDPARVVWARTLAERYPPDPDAPSGVPQVLRTGRPEFYPELPTELLDAAALDAEMRHILIDELQLCSYLIVPLRARGTSLGAITFVYGESGRHYTEADLALAQDLADRAALAVENARLYRDALTAIHVRDEFLASVSHDLRTPLTTIRGAGQVALRQLQRLEAPGTERAIHALSDVVEASHRMERAIASLLDLARLESGRPLDLNRQRTDLVSLVRGLVGGHLPGSSGLEVLFETTVPDLVGLWDQGRVERVVDNLLSNALKYSPTGGPIRVRLAAEPDHETGCTWARLDVEDQGIGIPAADLPRIFERFHRGSNIPTRTPGIGIGLAGARQIADLHGGTLTVESTEGVGSRFTLRLPMTEAEPQQS